MARRAGGDGVKGVLFNIAEEVVTEQWGADAWDDILDAAGVGGAYTALGQYDDAELGAIIEAAAATLGTDPADVLRAVGRLGFPKLAGRYEGLLADHRSSRSVLADLNGVIHPQVLVLYPGSSVPSFELVQPDGRPDHIDLVYRSGRHLCHLAEGLVLGLADRYGEVVEVDQTTCVHRGDDVCRIALRYVTDG